MSNPDDRACNLLQQVLKNSGGATEILNLCSIVPHQAPAFGARNYSQACPEAITCLRGSFPVGFWQVTPSSWDLPPRAVQKYPKILMSMRWQAAEAKLQSLFHPSGVLPAAPGVQHSFCYRCEQGAIPPCRASSCFFRQS